MNKRLFPFALMLCLGGSAAQAQVSLRINIGLPVVPHLYVVRPGIQVVEDFDDEVFFASDWYWCRRPGGWYRARHPRDRFDFVDVRTVPRDLVALPPGHYRHWNREHRVERWERREARWEEHRERERRREWREDRREDRHGHGEGRGHGHRDRD
ncbi:MAG: hypothetical protein U0P81_03150 [Holophagaceae bacterium]